MKWSYKIAEVRGIPVKAHVSLLLMFPFLAQDFGLVHGPMLALGLMVSITLHEMGHCVVAGARGCRVRDIILLPIGGMARLESMPRGALEEFQMAVAGPAVSLFLGGLLLVAGHYIPLRPMPFAEMNLVQMLGVVNLAWVVFNLLPAFPMDGGRILRAWLSSRLGRVRATVVAARVGRTVAILFGLVAVRLALGGYSAWTLMLIAVFVYFAAGSELSAVIMDERNRAFGMPPGRHSPGEGSGDNEVTIGPAPYGKGTSRTRLREEP